MTGLDPLDSGDPTDRSWLDCLQDRDQPSAPIPPVVVESGRVWARGATLDEVITALWEWVSVTLVESAIGEDDPPPLDLADRVADAAQEAAEERP